MRAYTDAIAGAMQRAERIERGLIGIEMDYASETRVRHWIEQHDAELVDAAYAMTVRFVVRMPAAARDAAVEIRDLTSGRASVEVRS